MVDLVPQGVAQDAHTRSPRNFEGMKRFSHEESYHSKNEAHDQMSRNLQEDSAYDPEEPGQYVNGKDKYTLSPKELRDSGTK